MAGFDSTPDIGFWLARKYALLQQNANASDTQNETQRIGTVAAAGVDNARAALIPKQGAADIAKTGAETGLIGQQAKYLGPEANSRIQLNNANAYATRIGGDVAYKEGIKETPTDAASYARIYAQRSAAGQLGGMPTMSNTEYSGVSLPSAAAQRLRTLPRDQWTGQDLENYNSLYKSSF